MVGLATSHSSAALTWQRFVTAFGMAAVGTTLGLLLLVFAIDPYGIRASPERAPAPIMDLNQRFMYPQIIRSGRYDSAVFGTSTIRLLDPRRLGELFGGHFANLGLNAGTPWEQAQLADLFLRHVSRPKTIVFGLDPTWCEPDADRKRLTFRTFPPWLYDDDPLNDASGFLSLRSVEIGMRVVEARLGRVKERIRGDGYEVFVPPESAYDLARAREHIRAYAAVAEGTAAAAPAAAGWPMPALAWLDDLLNRAPRETSVILTFMPVHAVAQPRPGTAAFARDEDCKARVAEMGARRGATVVDFRRRSPVTTEDSNYWDPLHYRIGVAERIAERLRDAHANGSEAPDGFDRLLTRGGKLQEKVAD